MENLFKRFEDLNIPMLEGYDGGLNSLINHSEKKKQGREAMLERYRKLKEAENPISFTVQVVNPDGSLRQEVNGVTLIIPPDQLFENVVLSAGTAKRYIGRHFTAIVTDISESGDVITASRVRAVVGDGSLRGRTNSRIRVLCNEVNRNMAPYLDELREKAKADAEKHNQKQRADGHQLHEVQIRRYETLRYEELYEQKKLEIGVKRCIVPATVEKVQGSVAVLNIFDLDIVGICSHYNWDKRMKAGPFREQVRPGDVVMVEVLYHADKEAYQGTNKIENAWVCSRKNLLELVEAGQFQDVVKRYPVKSTVQVICDRLVPSKGEYEQSVERWAGHIVDTDIRVFVRYGKFPFVITEGKTYGVQIIGADAERGELVGRTVAAAGANGVLIVPRRMNKVGVQKEKDIFVPETSPETIAALNEGNTEA